jgi:hypothetical protein
MELSISLAVIGAIIIGSTIFRYRKARLYKDLCKKLENQYNIQMLDSSGETEYTNCFSHSWIIENVVMRTHGRIGNAFQSYLMKHTLSTVICFSMLLGMFAFFLYYISPILITTFGPSIGVLLIGFILIMGPSNPHISQGLLDTLLEMDLEELNEEDYVYASLAYRTITQWSSFTIGIGLLFLVLAPFGPFLPDIVAYSVVGFTQVIIWQPTMAIAQFSIILAIVYIATIVPLFVIILAKSIQVVKSNLRKR